MTSTDQPRPSDQPERTDPVQQLRDAVEAYAPDQAPLMPPAPVPVVDDAYDAFRRAEVLLAIGRPGPAAELLTPVHFGDPANPTVLELLARCYLGSAQLARAEDALRQLVELTPADAWARFALARTLERRSRHDEAATQRRLAAALGLTG